MHHYGGIIKTIQMFPLKLAFGCHGMQHAPSEEHD